MPEHDERSGRETRLLALVIVVALAALFVGLNYIGVKVGIKAENTINTVVLVAVVVFIVFGLWEALQHPETIRFNFDPFFPQDSLVAAASSTRAAFSVHTSGRCRPVASAKPATIPVGSTTSIVVTAETTPEVPIETTTSPSWAATPSAAAALSPEPGPSTASEPVSVPTTSDGPATRGTCGRRPRSASSSRSYRYSPVRADQ